jgi:hypothetical protein
MAGYKAEGHSAEMAASRLMKKDKIRQRIAELVAPAARETAVTARTLVAELEAARAGASDDRQFGAATAAIIAKAKLLGLDRDGNGHGGQFDKLETEDQVIEAWLTEFETPAQALETLDAWREKVETFAGSHATLVQAVEPARPQVPGRETELALAELRPRYRRR